MTHYTNDPYEIETRYAIEDGMGFLDSIFTEPTEESLLQIEVVKDVLGCLPAREADFVELYFFFKLKQTEIADLFAVSQPTVCYRLQRACARIQFLLQLPKVTEAELRQDLVTLLTDPLDIEIMIGMWKTTCQSEVAKDLAVSQGLVRHRFLRTIKKMKTLILHQHPRSEALTLYINLFEFIAANLNILREVQRSALPHPEEPVLCILD